MIVIISFNDIGIVKAGKALGELYKEKVVSFGEGCFSDLKAGEQVVFLGHSDTGLYHWHGGEKLTPEKFLAKLEQFKCPFSKIQKMYIEGCKISLVSDNKSYLRQFGSELYKNPENRHIELLGFSNMMGHQILSDMYVAIPGRTDQATRVVGFNPEKKLIVDAEFKAEKDHYDKTFAEVMESCKEALDVFDKISAFIDELKYREVKISKDNFVAALNDFAKALEKIANASSYRDFSALIHNFLDTFKNFITIYPPQLTALKQTIDKFANEIDSFPGQLNHHFQMAHDKLLDTLAENHGSIFEFKTDVVSAMKANRSNLLNYELLEKLNHFDENRQLIWSIVNFHIAKLAEQKRKTTFDFFGKLSKPIARLTLILNEIEDPTHDLGDIIKKLEKEKIFSPEELSIFKQISQKMAEKKLESPAKVVDDHKG